MRFDITARHRLYLGTDNVLELEVFSEDGLDPNDYETDQAYDDAIVERGTMQDITGFTLRFDARKGASANDPPLITKITSNGISITGTFDAARATNTQRVAITLEDTDTNTLPARDYQYALKRTDAGFEKVLADGKMALLQSAVP